MTAYKHFRYAEDDALILPGVKIVWFDQAWKVHRKAVVVARQDNEWIVKVEEAGGSFLINERHIVAIEEAAVGSNRRGDFIPEAPAKIDHLPPVVVAAVFTQEEVKEQGEKPMAAEQPKPQITADVVIAAYIKTRDEIEAEKKIYEEKVAVLKAVQERREQWLTGELDKNGLSNFSKKGIGTAFFKNKTSATLADVTQFTEWVMAEWETRQHFMEKRVSKTAVDQAVADGDTPPPGTNYSTVRVIQINRNKG